MNATRALEKHTDVGVEVAKSVAWNLTWIPYAFKAAMPSTVTKSTVGVSPARDDVTVKDAVSVNFDSHMSVVRKGNAVSSFAVWIWYGIALQRAAVSGTVRWWWCGGRLALGSRSAWSLSQSPLCSHRWTPQCTPRDKVLASRMLLSLARSLRGSILLLLARLGQNSGDLVDRHRMPKCHLLLGTMAEV